MFKKGEIIKSQSFKTTQDLASFGSPVAAAHSWSKEGWDCYFNLALHREPPPLAKRGGENLASVSCFAHLDIDTERGHQDSGLCPDIDAALEILNNWVPPTITVLTGGGIHAYWRFKSPWIIDSDASRASCKQFHKRFQAVFREADVNPHGYRIDETYDLARVLRLPGTFNWKSGEPRPVRIHEMNPRFEYLISDLQALLPAMCPDVPHSSFLCIAEGGKKGFSLSDGLKNHNGLKNQNQNSPARARNLRKARRYVANFEPGISGTARGRHKYGLICVLKMIGDPFYLTNDEALQVLRSWAATCVPVFEDKNLLDMMESCRKKYSL